MSNSKETEIQKADFSNEDIKMAIREIEEWHFRRNSAFGFALIATGLAVLSIGEGIQVYLGCVGAFFVPYFLDSTVKEYYPAKQNELMKMAEISNGFNEKTIEEAKKAIKAIKKDGYSWVKSTPTVFGFAFYTISITYMLLNQFIG